MKTFLLRVNGDTDNDIALLTWTSHSGLTIQTISLLLPAGHRFTGGLSGLWQTEPPHINKNPSPLSLLTARQGRKTPSTCQLKRLHTRQNRHWLMQCESVQFSVCSTKNKETKQNSRVKNATQGWVLPNVLRYITPNSFLKIEWN